MSKSIAVVSAPATTLRLAKITGSDGIRSILTVVLGGADDVLPVMIPAGLNPEKVDELKGKLSSNPIIATIFAQSMISDKGVGVLNDDVTIEYISDEYPIMEIKADGYERHNLQTGEVETVRPSNATLH